MEKIMGVNIGIVNNELRWKENFGYIDNELIDIITTEANKKKFKCLKYLDKIDHTYFNREQWEQLQKEIDFLEHNKAIPSQIMKALKDCLLSIKKYPNYYFGFIGD